VDERLLGVTETQLVRQLSMAWFTRVQITRNHNAVLF